MKKILVCKKRSVYTIVDDIDYQPTIDFFRCFASLSYKRKKSYKLHPYAIGIRKDTGKWLGIHRFILSRSIGRELLEGEVCDHSNRDVLDNRRANLRIASKSQNQFNKGVKFSSKSGHKGVYFETDRNKWRVQVTAFGKTVSKRFNSLDEATEFSNVIRKHLHKEFSSM